MKAAITCFGQTTVCIKKEDFRIYFDPIVQKGMKKATHIFFSGYAIPTDISSIITKKTKIYCPSSFAESLKEYSPEVVTPGNTLDFFEVIPAYSVNEVVAIEKKIYNGYIVTLTDESFYFAGPTDVIPEMNLIHATVAFLPVDGISDVFAAIAATNIIAADLFVPIAYAANQEDGLLSCARFTLKCPHPCELFRKKKDVVEPNVHLKNSL